MVNLEEWREFKPCFLPAEGSYDKGAVQLACYTLMFRDYTGLITVLLNHWVCITSVELLKILFSLIINQVSNVSNEHFFLGNSIA